MASRYVINVTATDILRGVRNDQLACPIARAARRRFKVKSRERAGVRVHYHKLLVDQGGEWMTSYNLPQVASDFLDEFDSGEPVMPVRFEVSA
jgi:hypothetical protein